MDLVDVLLEVLERDASDLHLTVGSPPIIRINGVLERLDYPRLSANDTRELIYSILSQDQRQRLENEWEIDFSYSVPGRARFRVNAYFQRNSLGAAFRLIPIMIKKLEDLGLPQSLHDLTRKPRGFCVVTGPTGSGKSTTLAAMIDEINETREEHIMTIEDPIEFLHRHKKCMVNQREVGAVEALGVRAHLALIDHALLVPVEELDGVLDRHDVLFARLVDLVDHRRQCGGLARPRGPRDDDEAARFARELVQGARQPQVLELLDQDGDQAKRGAQAVALEVGVDAEARAPGHRVREVDLPLVLQALPLVLGEDAVDELPGVVGAQARVVEALEHAVDADDGRRPDREVQVAGVAFQDFEKDVDQVHCHFLLTGLPGIRRSRGRSPPRRSCPAALCRCRLRARTSSPRPRPRVRSRRRSCARP